MPELTEKPLLIASCELADTTPKSTESSIDIDYFHFNCGAVSQIDVLRPPLPPFAAAKRSSCFGRGLLGNPTALYDELSDKFQTRIECETWRSSKHHPNNQGRSRSKRGLRSH